MSKGSVSSFAAQGNRRETPNSRGHDRAQALRAMIGDAQVVYAVRVADGTIKIGCSAQLWNRVRQVGEDILGFRFGDMDDERAVHHMLRPHLARGREYYHPTPAVLAFVNELRDEWNLPHLAA